MAHVITAVKGDDADLVTIKTALLSVSDKTGLAELGAELARCGVLVRQPAARPSLCTHATVVMTAPGDYLDAPFELHGYTKQCCLQCESP